jgi:hypothetical protein
MNKRIVEWGLALVLLSGGAIGLALAQAPRGEANQVIEDDGDKAGIKLADAPAPVRAAIAKLTADKNVKQIFKEVSNGTTTYDVEYQVDGQASDVEISESGEVLEIATVIKAAALPEAASKAVAKAFPKGTIKGAESVQVFFYEVVVTVNGEDREIKVGANGQIADDDDDDGDDDNGKGDDEEEDEEDEDDDEDDENDDD